MKHLFKGGFSVILAVILAITAVCAAAVSASAEETTITYEYKIKCQEPINGYSGEVHFPSALTVSSVTISSNIYKAYSNKILFNASNINTPYDFSEGAALISVVFNVNGSYDANDITTTLDEFYSTANISSNGNYPYRYNNLVDNQVISGGYVDLDNPQSSQSDPKVTFEVDDSADTVVVERGTKVEEPEAPTKSGYTFKGWYSGDDLFDFDTVITEDITLTAKWKTEAKLLQANTVSFKDNLSLNFLATLDDEDVDNAYVRLSFNHYGEAKTETVNASRNDMHSNRYYRFRCRLTASEMIIPVTAELFVNGESKGTYTRSIREYCIAGIANSQRAEEIALFRATLNYGGYTQKHFKYNGEPESDVVYANKDYEDSMENVTVASTVNFNRPIDTVQGISYYGSSIFFRNAPFGRYYFSLESGADIGDYTFKIGGENKTAKHDKDNYYYIDSDTVLAYELDNVQNVVVKKGETELFNFNYSIVMWAQLAAERSTEETQKNMAKSLYAYYQAAKAFVESN